MPNSEAWLSWSLLAAACLHIIEEFVVPGGFPAWYRRYRGADAASVTTRFLIIINALLLLACYNAAIVPQGGIGGVYRIAIAALLASNGAWHLWASYKSRSYSPGSITGAIIYLPLAVYMTLHGCGLHLVSIPAALLAILIGASYTYWSKLFHSIRARHAAAKL